MYTVGRATIAMSSEVLLCSIYQTIHAIMIVRVDFRWYSSVLDAMYFHDTGPKLRKHFFAGIGPLLRL